MLQKNDGQIVVPKCLSENRMNHNPSRPHDFGIAQMGGVRRVQSDHVDGQSRLLTVPSCQNQARMDKNTRTAPPRAPVASRSHEANLSEGVSRNWFSACHIVAISSASIGVVAKLLIAQPPAVRNIIVAGCSSTFDKRVEHVLLARLRQLAASYVYAARRAAGNRDARRFGWWTDEVLLAGAKYPRLPRGLRTCHDTVCRRGDADDAVHARFFSKLLG